MESPIDQLTVEGYDMQWGTNVVGESSIPPLLGRVVDVHAPHSLLPSITGHYYLIRLLIPTLISTASASGSPSRVVTNSSIASQMLEKLDYDAFREGKARRKLGPGPLYYQSKLVSSLFVHKQMPDVHDHHAW